MNGNENLENQIETERETSFKEIIKILSEVDDVNFVENFFNCLLTPAEINDMATRWITVKEIEKGTPQREIAKKFHISLCKITRGSKVLKDPNSAFRKIFDDFEDYSEFKKRT